MAAIDKPYRKHFAHWHGHSFLNTRWTVATRYILATPLNPTPAKSFFYKDPKFKDKLQTYIKEKATRDNGQPSFETTTDTCGVYLQHIAAAPLVATKEQTTMAHGFIKLNRTPHFELFFRTRPYAWYLLSLIAQRARRTPCQHTQLQSGQAFIGRSDLPTHQIYRTACEQLTKGKFIRVNTTHRGTIATLLDPTIYDINAHDAQHSPHTVSTHPDNTVSTPNEEGKKVIQETTTTSSSPHHNHHNTEHNNLDTDLKRNALSKAGVPPSSSLLKLPLSDLERGVACLSGAKPDDVGAFVYAAAVGGWRPGVRQVVEDKVCAARVLAAEWDGVGNDKGYVLAYGEECQVYDRQRLKAVVLRYDDAAFVSKLKFECDRLGLRLGEGAAVPFR